LEWAKEKLTAEEINKCLLATNRDGNSIIILAVVHGSLDILYELLGWAKEKLKKKS